MQRIRIGQNRIGPRECEKLLFQTTSEVELDENAFQRVAKNHAFLKDFATDKVIYGVNTGFGPMAQFIIGEKHTKELQYNLIRSHASGLGELLPAVYSKSIMIARLNTLMLARSGIHESAVELLREMINRDICPCIYAHGSVGASGDLVQLAHLGLSMIGEGEVWYKGQRVKAEFAFATENLGPIKMHLREGLALMNGTSSMTGIGMVNLIHARRLLDWSILIAAMLNEIVEAYDDHFSEALNAAKLHKGQQLVAARLRKLLNDSQLIRSREQHLYQKPVKTGKVEDKIQEYYSIRCVTQVLGPILDTIAFSEKVLSDELNSANDNPLVFDELNNVYHGGNFHGDYVALEMDKLKIAITKLSMLLERQLNYLLNHKLNEKLPPFVNLGTLGLNFGMQGAQFTATSTTAENQTLSFPMYVHSIPNNNDNQDIVSMGTNAAWLTRKVIDNTFEVMAVELVTILQAIHFLKIENKLSASSREAYFDLRSIVPIFEGDFALSECLQGVKEFVKNEQREYIGSTIESEVFE